MSNLELIGKKLGMTREEYMAHYGSANAGINERNKKDYYCKRNQIFF